MLPYIPILRWKRGERVGLQNVSSLGRTDVRPLVVLAADQFRPRAATVSRPAVTAANGFVNEMMTAWAGAPIYVDAAAVPHSVGDNPIEDIAAAANAANAQLIPATKLDAPAAYQAAVGNVFASDRRGVVLRVDMQQFTDAARWTPGWQIPLEQTDLIVDLAENVSMILGLGSVIDRAFQTLHQATAWRSVTVAGSSMPGNFSGYPAGLHLLTRHELALWRQITTAGLPYTLQYGDYATVSTNAPPQGIAWGFPINVRYTLASQFLICRGVATTGHGAVDMDAQLLGHSQSINSYAARSPLAHCWADNRIDNIAAGTATPGNLESWVQIGVNRHIELTRSILP